MLAKRDFPSPHPLLWQLMITAFQRQQLENWVGELYYTSVNGSISCQKVQHRKTRLVTAKAKIFMFKNMNRPFKFYLHSHASKLESDSGGYRCHLSKIFYYTKESTKKWSQKNGCYRVYKWSIWEVMVTINFIYTIDFFFFLSLIYSPIDNYKSGKCKYKPSNHRPKSMKQCTS